MLKNSQYQGIDTTTNPNSTKLPVGAENGDGAVVEDFVIAAAYGKRFYIPLDFELLESHMLFYQSALGDRLEYELTFNDYKRVIQATGDLNMSYTIDNILLEYDMVTQSELARLIYSQYTG